jgi:macrolide transport system ATP-binding/permease protein
MGWFQRARNSWSADGSSFDEEAQFHLDQRTEEFVRAGMSPDAARREAHKRFGSVALANDRSSDANRLRWMDDFRRDVGYGLRMLRKNPGFSVLAILCLTLGIGANAAVFSWIEGVMLRPYPLVLDEDTLFVIAGTAPEATKGTDISWPDFKDLERSATTIQAFIADRINGAVIGLVNQKGERAPGSLVSANYFDALGVKPILGRGFQPGDDVGRNAHPIVVISYQLWQQKFSGNPSAVGSTIRLNGVLHTIVGVAPEGFYGTFVGYQFQFWVPASMQAVFDPGGYKLEDRGARWIEGFVRVKPGVSRAQAQAELSAMAERLRTEFPSTNRGRGLMLKPLWQSPFNPMDALVPTLTVALVGVAAMLLMACANVGNLLLLKSVARRGELTIRLAVGAGRGRLVRQLLTEAILLSSIAGACGLVAAYWARGALVFLFPPRGTTPLRLPADLDVRVLLLSIAVAFAATVLFGLIPRCWLARSISSADSRPILPAPEAVVHARGYARHWCWSKSRSVSS